MSLSTAHTTINFYGLGSSSVPSLSLPVSAIVMARVPTSTDIRNEAGLIPVGQVWVDSANNNVYFLSEISAGVPPTATWVTLGGATVGLNQLAGDTGTATPLSGAIQIGGTSQQIATSATANTLTANIINPLVAPGSVSATSGAITATNGDIVRGTAGNKDIHTSIASSVTAGSNAAGVVTLISGAATVATDQVTGASFIRLYRQNEGTTVGALGVLTVPLITALTSFNISSRTFGNAAVVATDDESIVFWELLNG